MEADKRTMLLIQKIANSIDPQIQFTFDVPSNYSDNMVPILDVKAGINEDNEIDYIFYQKPMQNRLVVPKQSAMPLQQKMTILTQECFRRLHNKRETIVDEDLKTSGYSEQERQKITHSVPNAFFQPHYNRHRRFYELHFLV